MRGPRKILAATASPESRAALEQLLEETQAETLWAGSPAEISAALAAHAVSAVFLDAENPGLPVGKLCRSLRRELPAANCALILFGVRMEGPALVLGLDWGADHCWSLPFNIPVCRAYLRALLRRVTLLEPSNPCLKAVGLVLDPKRRRLSIAGRDITLRVKEFDLLYLLLKRRGEVVSRQTLMQEVWGTEYFGTTRTIDFHISQVRRKLGPTGRRIETVAGLGYRFSSK